MKHCHKQINILFLGGGKRASLAEKFIEEGMNLNMQVNIFAYEICQENPISFVAKKTFIGKKWNDVEIYKDLIQICDQNNINILLPFVDPATVIVAKLKEKLSRRIFIPISNEEQILLFFDKIQTTKWCEKNEITIPSVSNLDYPLIAKPRFGSASKGISIISNCQQLAIIDKNQFLVQQFISGIEFTIDCYIAQNGKIISIIPRQRLEVQGGESIKSITVKNHEIINFSREIILKSGLIGPITIQLIWESNTKELYFIELNPRFGGGVLNSIGAGANIPRYLLNDFCGLDQEYDETWEGGVMMIRRYVEYFKKLNHGINC